MEVRLGGLAPLTPPFKQGVRSSNLRRVTTSSRTALVRDGFFIQKAISHLFRRSSFPKCKHFIGLHFGFSSNAWKQSDTLPFCPFYERQSVYFWCPKNNYLDSRTTRLSQRFLNASSRRKPQKGSAIRPFGTIIPIFIRSKSTWISPPRSLHSQKRI